MSWGLANPGCSARLPLTWLAKAFSLSVAVHARGRGTTLNATHLLSPPWRRALRALQAGSPRSSKVPCWMGFMSSHGNACWSAEANPRHSFVDSLFLAIPQALGCTTKRRSGIFYADALLSFPGCLMSACSCLSHHLLPWGLTLTLAHFIDASVIDRGAACGFGHSVTAHRSRTTPKGAGNFDERLSAILSVAAKASIPSSVRTRSSALRLSLP